MYTALILAAGEGKRMKSRLPKVLHEIAFKPLICWVLEAVSGADGRIVVVGHGADEVKSVLGESVSYAVQEQRLGTGHAVAQAKDLFRDARRVLILSGDTPLITRQTLDAAYACHTSGGNAVTVLTAHVPNPNGYGRILRGSDGNLAGIVEHADASEAQRAITEVNSGIYFFDTDALLFALDRISNGNAQGEYYLTDAIGILLGEHKKAGAFTLGDHNEIIGINDRVQLAAASERMRERIIRRHMENGVTFLSPQTAYIGGGAVIGRDTIIMPNTVIEGDTTVAEGCVIGPNSRITASEIGAGSEINNSVVVASKIGGGVHVGPFAYIRPHCEIGDNIKIGDFVEIKNAVIGDGTKVSHLTYIGDADVGAGVNFGCGTVIVNYDGSKKHRATVGDGAFIGCNTNLVSPVRVGDGAFIAAGSTITEDIPNHAFAIARSRQTVKTEWKRK
jgi:bifunctional UDP-N-acetylglucosamine pyrophosphorylase/glucosamine-1-phosphate N-acetyltransferase